ncbi:protein of unknown function (plasmid) [Cupriavidus neocaledonicus]|uniref:Uncharacterized protein n=1 Tax=Cupriavidus neocaledonicus TaxID=1040979 RepID=A0A375HSA8_9BURK|nr:protein of unknown function [Cupriavidus neocaledonicus]
MLDLAVPSDYGSWASGFPIVVIRNHAQLVDGFPNAYSYLVAINVPQFCVYIKGCVERQRGCNAKTGSMQDDSSKEPDHFFSILRQRPSVRFSRQAS